MSQELQLLPAHSLHTALSSEAATELPAEAKPGTRGACRAERQPAMNTAAAEHRPGSSGKICPPSAPFWEQPKRDRPDCPGWFCRKEVEHFQNVRFLEGPECCQGMFHFGGAKPRARDGSDVG